MNATQEVREQYKQALKQHIEFPHLAFFQGKKVGLGVALNCLGVNGDERQEIYKTAKEEIEHDRIRQAATDAANQIERGKEQEQEELDAIEHPASQARQEADQ